MLVIANAANDLNCVVIGVVRRSWGEESTKETKLDSDMCSD